jgi:hypothetical protein
MILNSKLTLCFLHMDIEVLVPLVIEDTNNMPILFHTYMHPHCPFSSSHTVLSRWLLSSFK